MRSLRELREIFVQKSQGLAVTGPYAQLRPFHLCIRQDHRHRTAGKQVNDGDGSLLPITLEVR